uniref:mitogen-activated protein kinase kinase n=1 Tax=Panagrolaimus davidi TaxID=227884 RepID=A0A914QSE4_9BILA
MNHYQNEEDRKYERIKNNSGKLQIGPQLYENVKIDNLRVMFDLGSGAFGKVTQRVLNNRILAVKEMQKTDNEEENKRIYMDLQVITCNDCSFIVKSYGYIITFDHVYICMEKMEMCLEKLNKKYIKPQEMNIPECILGKITVPVVTALKYLNDEHEIMHRDIKPSNILIDLNGNIKLCDFGIAGKIIDSDESIGCRAYLSPERMKRSKYDIRADIWSLGITLIELATSKFPYPFESYFELFYAVTEMSAPKLPKNFSHDFHEFLDKCLEKDVEKRANYNELESMKWYQIQNALKCDVEKWLANVCDALIEDGDSEN